MKINFESMKGGKTSFKKVDQSTKKVKKNLERIKDLQLKGDGVNLPTLSKKITHSRARLGLAGRSFLEYEVRCTKCEVLRHAERGE